MQRSSGVLLPVFSLPSDYGIGSFGQGAFAFLDFLKSAGFSVWQTLPLCLPDEFHSPYKSFGAFSLNPYFIDLPTLREGGLLTAGELESAKQKTPYACEYERLERERLPLLRKAAEHFDDWEKVTAFLDLHPETADFCRFMALKEQNGGVPFWDFQEKTPDSELVRFWAFLQYQCYSQWQTVKKHAEDLGISVIGDMPIYVAEDSADVYDYPENFELDKRYRPTAVAGVPPDYFSAEGQLWGNPLYDFSRMKKDGFAFWRRRAAFAKELFDGVRLDHFRAFASYYRIEAGKSAKEGKFKKGPGMALIRALTETAGEDFFIAEDLGDITEDVVALVKSSGFPSMRVLQFAFLGDPKSVHLPHNCGENTVYYTGTHDNNTLLGYVFEMPEAERRHLFAYCGFEGADWNTDAAYNAVFRTVFATNSKLLLLPIQDLLLYGNDTRIDVPGRATGNWEYRVTKEQLKAISAEKFLTLNRRYGR